MRRNSALPIAPPPWNGTRVSAAAAPPSPPSKFSFAPPPRGRGREAPRSSAEIPVRPPFGAPRLPKTAAIRGHTTKNPSDAASASQRSWWTPPREADPQRRTAAETLPHCLWTPRQRHPASGDAASPSRVASCAPRTAVHRLGRVSMTKISQKIPEFNKRYIVHRARPASSRTCDRKILLGLLAKKEWAVWGRPIFRTKSPNSLSDRIWCHVGGWRLAVPGREVEGESAVSSGMSSSNSKSLIALAIRASASTPGMVGPETERGQKWISLGSVDPAGPSGASSCPFFLV